MRDINFKSRRTLFHLFVYNYLLFITSGRIQSVSTGSLNRITWFFELGEPFNCQPGHSLNWDWTQYHHNYSRLIIIPKCSQKILKCDFQCYRTGFKKIIPTFVYNYIIDPDQRFSICQIVGGIIVTLKISIHDVYKIQ